jgi:Protein of unknown function (DUF3455)
MRRLAMAAAAALTTIACASAADLPEAIRAPGEVAVLQVHALGAQVYECKAGQAGAGPTWQFREPIATLVRDGKTIGRHFAGPTWEADGGTIVGKAAGRAPGASPKDIPWLKLAVIERHGSGPLLEAATVQRLNTVGGTLEGACQTVGELRAEPYSADYVFLKKQSP